MDPVLRRMRMACTIKDYLPAIYDKHTKRIACSREILASDKTITLLRYIISIKQRMAWGRER